jgi:polysaccharide biosynthesis transport protein
MLADNRLTALARGDARRNLPEPSSPPAPSADYLLNEEKDLRSHLALIYKRKWLILSVVLLTTTVVAVYMFRLPSVYEAETTLRIEQKSESFLRAKDIVINTANDPAYWRTQLKLLENPMLLRRVVLTLDLQNNPAFLNARAQSSLTGRTGVVSSLGRLFSRNKTAEANDQSQTLPAGMSADEMTPEQRARLAPFVNSLKAGLTIEPEVGTNLIKIRFTHPDPEIARKVTDTLAGLFIQDDAKRENEGLVNASTQLAMQIADLQMAIKQQETERIDYIKNHGLPLGQMKGENLTSVRLDTLSGQLLGAENERKSLQSLYEAASKAGSAESIPAVQDDRAVQEIKQKLRDLEQRRAALGVKFTPEWPEVKEIDGQISQLTKDLTKTTANVVATLKSRYEAALKREDELRSSYYGELGAANLQSQSEIELNNLNQKIETNKQLYGALFQRQKELQIDASDRKGNASIATLSELPGAPVGPQRARNIAVSFFISLFAGVGLAFLLQQLDDSIKSVDELVAYTNLPNLALIPAVTKPRLARAADASALTRGKGVVLSDILEDPRSPVAEAFRHLRTSLLFSSGARSPRSILITSGQALEGKTTVAFNTAVALAQTGASVLLIDCDLRRPSIQKYIDAGSDPGLTNYLAGEIALDEALRTYEVLPALKVMTSGYSPSNPAEILGSDEMSAFLTEMKSRFTYVIIDSPPSISFADGAIISTQVDGVVVVVHGGRSSRAVVRHIIHRLTGIGANICGTVLNNVKPQPYDYYYNSYYYSYQSGGGASPGAGLKKRSQPSVPELNITAVELEREFEKFRRATRDL